MDWRNGGRAQNEMPMTTSDGRSIQTTALLLKRQPDPSRFGRLLNASDTQDSVFQNRLYPWNPSLVPAFSVQGADAGTAPLLFLPMEPFTSSSRQVLYVCSCTAPAVRYDLWFHGLPAGARVVF